jgi:pyruvate dehydrogenase kinase 2/3/4
VIAEQHLALTETFNSPWHFPDAAPIPEPQDYVGEVFLKCNARDVVESCGKEILTLAASAYGPDAALPELKFQGHLDATFPYILSHLEYIIGEILRNSVQAAVEHQNPMHTRPPPIEITICEAPQHVIIRVSDQGGGIPHDILPYLWSFSKGPRSQTRLENLTQVPKMAATMQELKVPQAHDARTSSLASMTSRPPNLRLGMGLPMARVYAGMFR